ncbi:MAG: hypothetical protein EA389_13400 [Ilumatobacter sp.]|nr:MAG: hypothetical protein EA389_13400 [Ilumatobacter sp.]
MVSGKYEFRDYELVVPSWYDGSEPVPLVLSLHGYTGSGPVQESYFRLGPLAEERGFLLVTPNGTFDAAGSRFWNATDACCNFGGAEVDDVAHLLGLVDEISAAYEVDPLRIHLVGHSNGGFMSYRMACEHADVFASVVSLAGATLADAAACAPSEPVGVVQVHGTQDQVIRFEGGSTPGGPYPGAIDTVSAWAAANGCGAAEPSTAPVLDLDDGRPGADSTITAFTGCPAGGAVELWTIVDGAHVPPLSDGFRIAVVDAVLANPKPPGSG